MYLLVTIVFVQNYLEPLKRTSCLSRSDLLWDIADLDHRGVDGAGALDIGYWGLGCPATDCRCVQHQHAFEAILEDDVSPSPSPIHLQHR